MVKVNAVSCDLASCARLGVPKDGADIPEGWLLVDVYIEGEGNMEGRALCSWACMANYANNRIQQPKKRVRRTRAQIEADEAALREVGV
jgi:hypothetical protein